MLLRTVFSKDEEGVENLAENTTVIAVNIASLAGGGTGDGSKLVKPDTSVLRTPSNRSATDGRDLLKVRCHKLSMNSE